MAQQRTQNMTQGSPAGLLVTFALPLMVGNVFQQLYTVIDTAIVGQIVGVQALAALGAADWLSWLVLSMLQGLGQGFSVLMAQHFGAKDYRQLSQTVGASAALYAVTSAVLLAASQCAIVPVLRLLNTPADIFGDAALYLRILFGGIPIVAGYNLLASVLQSMGDSKTPLYAIVVAALLNISLDLLFVMGFQWGVAGAALATVLAQAVSMIYCYRNVRQISVLNLERSYFRPNPALSLALLKLGSPVAMQNAIISVGGMVVQSVVNRYGMLFIAGFTATNKLYGLLEIAATSYGYAVTSFMGQNLGGGFFRRIRQGMRAAVCIALLTSVGIAVFMLLLGKPLLRLFISGEPEQAARSLQIAYRYLAIMSIALPILYLLHIYRSALIGLGDTVVPMGSGLMELVMRVGIALLLPLAVGQDGIFYAEVGAWVGATALLMAAYHLRAARLPQENPPGTS